jgi:hypothetical protein
MPSVRRRCSSQRIGMSGVWSRSYFGLARRYGSVRWRGFIGRGLQLRRVHKAGVWIISKTRDQKSLVDHGNLPYCCVYCDLLLCCPLSAACKRPPPACLLFAASADRRFTFQKSRQLYDASNRGEKAPVTQASACVSRLIHRLSLQRSRRSFH